LSEELIRISSIIGRPFPAGGPEGIAPDLGAVRSRRLALTEDEDIGRYCPPYSKAKAVAERLNAEQVMWAGDFLTGNLVVVSSTRVNAPSLSQIEFRLVLLGISDEHGHLLMRLAFAAKQRLAE